MVWRCFYGHRIARVRAHAQRDLEHYLHFQPPDPFGGALRIAGRFERRRRTCVPVLVTTIARALDSLVCLRTGIVGLLVAGVFAGGGLTNAFANIAANPRGLDGSSELTTLITLIILVNLWAPFGTLASRRRKFGLGLGGGYSSALLTLLREFA